MGVPEIGTFYGRPLRLLGTANSLGWCLPEQAAELNAGFLTNQIGWKASATHRSPIRTISRLIRVISGAVDAVIHGRSVVRKANGKNGGSQEQL